MTLDEKINYALQLAGVIIALMSLFSSFANHIIRLKTAAGETPSKLLMSFAAVTNFLSVNLDKGVQFVKMTQGKPVPQTVTVQPTQPPEPVKPTDPPAQG